VKLYTLDLKLSFCYTLTEASSNGHFVLRLHTISNKDDAFNCFSPFFGLWLLIFLVS